MGNAAPSPPKPLPPHPGMLLKDEALRAFVVRSNMSTALGLTFPARSLRGTMYACFCHYICCYSCLLCVSSTCMLFESIRRLTGTNCILPRCACYPPQLHFLIDNAVDLHHYPLGVALCKQSQGANTAQEVVEPTQTCRAFVLSQTRLVRAKPCSQPSQLPSQKPSQLVVPCLCLFKD